MKILMFVCLLSAFLLLPSAPKAETSTKPAAETTQQPTQPTLVEQREIWSGRLYTSTYRAGVCIDPMGKVRGVLLVRTMGGAVDPYHFSGNVENGSIRATHGSGHSFKGSFASDDEVQGTITLKSGRNISLSGKRQHNVELTESCRPLPE